MNFLTKTEKRIGTTVTAVIILISILFGGFQFAYNFAGKGFIQLPNPLGVFEKTVFIGRGVRVTVTTQDRAFAKVEVIRAGAAPQTYKVCIGDEPGDVWYGYLNSGAYAYYSLGSYNFTFLQNGSYVKGEDAWFQLYSQSTPCPEWAALCFHAVYAAKNVRFNPVRENPMVLVTYILAVAMIGTASAYAVHFAAWVVSRLRRKNKPLQPAFAGTLR